MYYRYVHVYVMYCKLQQWHISCMFMCIRTYVCMYVYIHTYVCMYVHIRMYVRIYILCICTYVRMHVVVVSWQPFTVDC